jgi:hypothetical protein
MPKSQNLGIRKMSQRRPLLGNVTTNQLQTSMHATTNQEGLHMHTTVDELLGAVFSNQFATK